MRVKTSLHRRGMATPPPVERRLALLAAAVSFSVAPWLRPTARPGGQTRAQRRPACFVPIAGGAGAYDTSPAIALGVVPGMTRAFRLHPLFNGELVVEFQHLESSYGHGGAGGLA